MGLRGFRVSRFIETGAGGQEVGSGTHISYCYHSKCSVSFSPTYIAGVTAA